MYVDRGELIKRNNNANGSEQKMVILWLEEIFVEKTEQKSGQNLMVKSCKIEKNLETMISKHILLTV